MKPVSIVYTSKTDHTRQYAQLLSEALGLPAYSLPEAGQRFAPGSEIIYMGWLKASHVVNYGNAAKRFHICAVCGVGLCDTGELLEQVRAASKIPESVPLFTLQGGIDRSRLKGLDKLMIDMLAKGLASQKERTAQDERTLELLSSSESLVSRDNLNDVISWYNAVMQN